MPVIGPANLDATAEPPAIAAEDQQNEPVAPGAPHSKPHLVPPPEGSKDVEPEAIQKGTLPQEFKEGMREEAKDGAAQDDVEGQPDDVSSRERVRGMEPGDQAESFE